MFHLALVLIGKQYFMGIIGFVKKPVWGEVK